MDTRFRRIRNTVVAAVTLLVFFYAQGAAVFVFRLEGVKSALVRAAIILACAAAAIVFYLIKYRSLRPLGFTAPEKGGAKTALFYIPAICAALVSFAGGLEITETSLLFANLLLTLSIGLAEEIYFRGIICGVWAKENKKAAVLISAALFALCHLLNVMGGVGVFLTALQVVFAFAYGVVFALIFIRCESIIPCVLLHAFHDLCGFITADGEIWVAVTVGAAQFIIIALYGALLWKRILSDGGK